MCNLHRERGGERERQREGKGGRGRGREKERERHLIPSRERKQFSPQTFLPFLLGSCSYWGTEYYWSWRHSDWIYARSPTFQVKYLCTHLSPELWTDFTYEWSWSMRSFASNSYIIHSDPPANLTECCLFTQWAQITKTGLSYFATLEMWNWLVGRHFFFILTEYKNLSEEVLLS